MDLTYLLNILLRRKWLLLSVILISALATWFFIGKLPDTYKAESIISTGIIDYKGVSLQRESQFLQQFMIESSFNGMLEKMKGRAYVKTLTDKLLVHDLLADGSVQKPFRTLDQGDMELSENEIDDIVMKLKANLTDSLLNSKPTPIKPDPRLAEAYGYDYESLMKKLEITRLGETDYLKVDFESENPELSYYVVNTFLDGFFKQHEADLSSNEDQALKYNEKKLKQVKAELDSVIKEINDYKTTNGLLDVSTQRETVIGQKQELELRLQETEQSIPSLERNIALVQSEMLEYNKTTANNAYNQFYHNSAFTELDEPMTTLQNQIIDARVAGNKNVEALERKLETLKEKRMQSLQKSLSAIPKSEKESIDEKVRDLVKKELEMKLDLDLAKEAKRSYINGIAKLDIKTNKLLIADNQLYSMEEEKNRLDLEYQKIRKELKDSEYFAEGTESPLAVIEPVELPTEPESKNRTVFSVFAGVAGGTLTSIFLFMLAFMDTSISTPGQFSRITNLPMLGFVNKVKVKNANLEHLFAQTQTKNELEYFKENIRKIRTAIENSGAKSFLFVSPKEQEGKSFLIVLLAYALSLNNKKVLVIDTNFKNNTLSAFKSKSFIEITTVGQKMGNPIKGQKSLSSGETSNDDPHMKNIDIVGNKGGSQSPSEVLAGKDFKKIMEGYKRKYDFIFMEAAAMNKFADARELLPYAEKLAVVFSAETPIGNTDKETLEYLKGMNGKMFGGILNNVDFKNI